MNEKFRKMMNDIARLHGNLIDLIHEIRAPYYTVVFITCFNRLSYSMTF